MNLKKVGGGGQRKGFRKGINAAVAIAVMNIWVPFKKR